MNARTAAILLAAAALTACAVPPDGPTQSVGEDYSNLLPQRDIYAVETFSGLTARTGRLVLDQPSWKMMWDSITANFGAKKPTLPDVDFSTHVVLVAAAGSTPTQLVSFQITGVRQYQNFMGVTVEVNWPACGGVPVVTTPVHVVSVPRVATEAKFTFVNTSTSC